MILIQVCIIVLVNFHPVELLAINLNFRIFQNKYLLYEVAFDGLELIFDDDAVFKES